MIIVRGALPLVDAYVVRFLKDLADRHGTLRVFPERALLDPTVGLSDLRYVLARLRSVGEVLDSGGLPADRSATDFPADALARQAASLARPAPLDEPPPAGCGLEDIEAAYPLVLLTGCFDLIHAGHLRLMEAATAYGARPVVAMLKSRGISEQPKNRGDRPLWSMADRVTFLRALRLPIQPLLFDGPDSRSLIRTLRPDVWVKEERDRQRRIVAEEAGLVESYGGRVAWVLTGTKQSTTEIARTLRGCRRRV